MIPTTDFRKGVKLLHNNQPYAIVDFQHVSPGKGSAFVRTKIKNLLTGQVLEVTYKSGDVVPAADVEVRKMQFLYSDNTTYTFMDQTSYDQVQIDAEVLGDQRFYIVENGEVQATFFDGKPIGIEVETFVVLEIKETQPNIRGDTSGGGGKPATLSTGLVVTVPFHLNVGDLIKVDSRTGTYVEKVKGR